MTLTKFMYYNRKDHYFNSELLNKNFGSFLKKHLINNPSFVNKQLTVNDEIVYSTPITDQVTRNMRAGFRQIFNAYNHFTWKNDDFYYEVAWNKLYE